MRKPSAGTPPRTPRSQDAAHLTGSAFPATAVIKAYVGSAADTAAVHAELKEKAQELHLGDIRQIECMLLHQAIALQSMFMDLASRAKAQDSLSAIQTLTQLALRAQSGSRSALQVLAEMKAPRPVAFVRQTNVAHNQQVNNGVVPPPAQHPRAQELEPTPNELLVEEDPSDGLKKLDTRAAPETSGVDTRMAAMEAVHRPSDQGGKAKVRR